MPALGWVTSLARQLIKAAASQHGRTHSARAHAVLHAQFLARLTPLVDTSAQGRADRSSPQPQRASETTLQSTPRPVRRSNPAAATAIPACAVYKGAATRGGPGLSPLHSPPSRSPPPQVLARNKERRIPWYYSLRDKQQATAHRRPMFRFHPAHPATVQNQLSPRATL